MSKHEHEHQDTAPTPEHGYWKSLRELEGKASWQLHPHTREFEPGSDEPPPADPMSRRNFFHLMGASLGMAGIAAGAGCQRYEAEKIVPLARRPENQTPGQTLQYATTFELGGSAHALVATSFEGRPIHLDGNPEHPFAGGAIVPGTKRHGGASTFAQASILNLYDVDRSQTPLNRGKGATLDSFKAALAEIKKGLTGARILSEATSSPTVAALRKKLEAAGAQWLEYEPLSWDNERTGTRTAIGRTVRPLAKLDKAETIVCIDCDIFVEHPAAMRYNRDFARSRRKDGSLGVGKMNRLWAAESVFTNTGAMADHRLAMRAELGLPFALALDAALSNQPGPQSEWLREGKVQQFISVLAEELKANNGRAVVLAGRRQPPTVHALVAKINAAIGAHGTTLEYVEDPEPNRMTHLQAIQQLAADMRGGKVQTVVMLGGNPVYDAPADLDFGALLSKVPTSVHLSEYANETSQLATWHVPKAHFLEAWGDARTWDGTVTLAQPLVQPIYGGISSIEFLSLLLGDEKAGDELVRTTHEGKGNWKQLLHDGYIPNSAYAPAQVSVQGLSTAMPLTPSQQAGSKRKNGELEVVYHFSWASYDGRYSNNPWLWETPDFLTKVTWDNYALVAPETATALGVKNDDMITVKVGQRSITLPCYTMPGQARYSIGLVLGGGRTQSGHAGAVGSMRNGIVGPGWNTYKVRGSENDTWDIATGCSIAGGGGTYTLANVQEHWNYRPGSQKLMGYDPTETKFDPEVDRRAHEIVEEISNEDLQKNNAWKAESEHEFWDDEKEAEVTKQKARHLSLFEEHDYHGHRWGMAIDLSTCTGCNSCMIACQSENNVPTVGRNQVMRNREMHWIRIDRYFTGTVDEPHVVHQPLPCQQCENAPCEQVCPVGATSHSQEGLNDMAYNRCIGTRYCANNCPYRVRRFNFLDWNKEYREARMKVRRLLFNPDVTVRMRGVMEKCTYCVQRIQNAKIRAKAQLRNPNPTVAPRTGTIGGPLPDGEIETACQQACPTEAIVFGDLSDPNSRVSKAHADRRSYALLPELYTRPRTQYLTRVLNPNPKMPQLAREGH